MKKPILLDETDKRILEILHCDARISLKELGQLVHLTGQAVKNRLERLTEIGILQQYTIKLDCPVYGYQIHALIWIYFQLLGKSKLVDLLRRGNYHLEHCYQITGKQAYFLDGHFRNYEELQQLLHELEKYGSYEVEIVLQDVLKELISEV